MRALHWDGRKLKFEKTYPTPTADDRNVLIRIRLAGICSTDLQIFKGYMGFQGIPGHEFVGEVKEGPAEIVGKRVVGEINFACGRCELCAGGLGRHCPERRVMGIVGADGSFGEYAAVPTENLHLVAENLRTRKRFSRSRWPQLLRSQSRWKFCPPIGFSYSAMASSGSCARRRFASDRGGSPSWESTKTNSS